LFNGWQKASANKTFYKEDEYEKSKNIIRSDTHRDFTGMFSVVSVCQTGTGRA
jgi:hypothetical protein